MLTRRAALCALAACLFASSAGADDKKLKVLIVDGQNNHRWDLTTPVLRSILEKPGRFTVEVATSPKQGDKAGMAKFKPAFADYDAVVMNYNGEPWPKETQKAFEDAVSSGKTGLVIIHAANNSFPGWKEYNEMIGMGWRGKDFGDRLKWSASDDKVVRMPKGKDLDSSHRYVGPFVVTVRDAKHPVTAGMPEEWMHVSDELYDNMRGPAKNVRVLATAYSDKKKRGTGEHEPMIWTVSYGKGRVFHTPMGHDVNAMKCVGFALTVQRGTEWAATGKVTVPVPKEFPTAKKAMPLK